MADEAFLIGKAPSRDSYLSIPKILQVAKLTGSKAVHPGYGFLSENCHFAEQLAKEGITFIGPPIQALKEMGSKSASKLIMTAAGVPVVPGYHGENQDPYYLKAEARKIGYPIMIKAVLGGGGKGMRIVENEEQFDEMLESSRRESLKSFNDDRVLLEKYIRKSRHVEVQIFGDSYGNVVYLFERDCSLQRRHQKILEEAPAPGISEHQRQQLGNMAVTAAKAVHYVGAGTVEFIFDCETEKFYFMEMNTRLQVEHPVTEMITGLDLVHWQIYVASGNLLPLNQDQVTRQGHAIEARIYAENTQNNFMPDTGELVFLQLPESNESVRIETGIRQHNMISVYYDPMIAKVIVRGQDRRKALLKLDHALSQFYVVGVRTNISLIRRIINHKLFQEGPTDTGFIVRNQTTLLRSSTASPDKIGIAAVLPILLGSQAPYRGPWFRKDSFAGFMERSFNIKLKNEDKLFNCLITHMPTNQFVIKVGDQASIMVQAKINSNGKLDALVDGQLYSDLSFFRGENGNFHIFFADEPLNIQFVSDSIQTTTDVNHSNIISSPMSCRVSSIKVKVGDAVKKGDTLMIVEAMKMEHVIKSPRDARVNKVYFTEGQLVGERKPLVELREQ